MQEENSSLNWHPEFITAVKLELKEYLDKIEILPEVPLTAEPLKIDCVIIKKAKGLVIKKNFAAIFRKWNILEYKSPKDHVSVNDYQKVYAYACLYSSFKNVPINDITISFIESRYPRKLIDFLREKRKFTVEKNGSGIYTVKGDAVAIQIVDSRYLPDEENLWLKNLRGKLDKNTIVKVIDEIHKQDKAVSLEAYIEVISRANTEFFEEVTEMRAPTFKQVVMESKIGASWIKEWKSEAEAKGKAIGEAKGEAIGEARGVAIGRAESSFSIAQNMVKMGFPIETVISATQLDPEKVKILYQ
jgi:hypothetical protein